jgi:hypothetical protein
MLSVEILGSDGGTLAKEGNVNRYMNREANGKFAWING